MPSQAMPDVIDGSRERQKARFGGVRNSAPRALQSAYTAWMSETLMLRKLLARSGSCGVSSVTAGLSPVGPPPTLMMIQRICSPCPWSPRRCDALTSPAAFAGAGRKPAPTVSDFALRMLG